MGFASKTARANKFTQSEFEIDMWNIKGKENGAFHLVKKNNSDDTIYTGP